MATPIQLTSMYSLYDCFVVLPGKAFNQRIFTIVITFNLLEQF